METTATLEEVSVEEILIMQREEQEMKEQQMKLKAKILMDKGLHAGMDSAMDDF